MQKVNKKIVALAVFITTVTLFSDCSIAGLTNKINELSGNIKSTLYPPC